MWNEIQNNDDLSQFLNAVNYFHDSCIREMKYISGAYINDDLYMYPLNDSRILSVVIQRQSEKYSTIEMEFQKLKYLKLMPVDENYTCEILGATMFFKDHYIYWCDSADLSENDLEGYVGTLICASKLRWRSVNQRTVL